MGLRHVIVVFSMLVVFGCGESFTPIDGGNDASLPDTGPRPDAADADTDAGRDLGPCQQVELELPLRRLRAEQYDAIYRALTGAAPLVDPPANGTEERLGSVPTPFRLADVEALRANAMAAGPLIAARSSCGVDAACLRIRLETLLIEAYRRPARTDELNFFLDSYDATLASIGDPVDAFSTIAMVILQSPFFAFVVELGEPPRSDDLQVPLRRGEQLTRLSLAFTNQGPPAADFSGDLSESALQSRVETWLDGGAPGIGRFHQRWLQTRATSTPDDELEASFEAETDAFVRDVYANDPLLSTLLTAPYSFLDRNTGAAYGVTVSSSTPTRTDLNPAAFSGLLTHGSWLAGRRFTVRGSIILEQLRCSTVPEPPPGVDNTPPEPLPGETVRQAFERIASTPACGGCHSLLDPYGFALGDFDELGGFMSVEDTSAELPDGTMLDGAAELGQVLAASVEVRRCFVDRWATFLIERDLDEGASRPEESIACELDPLMEEFAADDDLRAMLPRLATHPALHLRAARGTGEPEPPGPGRDLSAPLADLTVLVEQNQALGAVLTTTERQSLDAHLAALRELELRLSSL